MLNLFDYLTEKDNKLIENYITTFGIQDGYVGNEKYLSYWAANNKKLFKLLGGQLIYKVPYEYEMEPYQIKMEFNELKQYHPFIKNFGRFCYGESDKPMESAKLFQILRKDNFSNEEIGRVCYQIQAPLNVFRFIDNTAGFDFKFKRPSKRNTLRIDEKMKIMRAIRAILLYFDVDKEVPSLYDDFIDFQNKYSVILNTKKIKCEMCFSIHPLDYLTMSDNANHWTSCMSWVDQGCYHVGTVEMMNSNNVICVYLNSSTPFVFDKEQKDTENYTWNNKKWRQLFYCTKEIIVSGKPYPYTSKPFTQFALETLRNLAKNNWNQDYEYGIEPYRDMIHMGSYYRMENNRRWIHNKTSFKHNIIFDSRGMYNDMFNDPNTDYWCVRNKVPHSIIINYSGKAPCACCMDDVLTFDDPYIYDEGSYNDRYSDTSKILCRKCIRERSCSICGNDYGKYKIITTKDGRDICTDCIKRYFKICPDCGKPFFRNSYDSRDEAIYAEIKGHHLENIFLKYLPYPSTDIDDKDIEFQEDGLPVAVLYQCCDECRQRLVNEGKVEYRSVKHGWTLGGVDRFLNIPFLKGTYDLNDPDIKKHRTANLKCADIEKDLI